MDDLRKTNSFMGKMIEDINTDTTDEELSNYINVTVGQVIDAFSEFPESLRKLTFGQLMDIVIDPDSIDEILVGVMGENPSKEQCDEAANGFIKFAKALGI